MHVTVFVSNSKEVNHVCPVKSAFAITGGCSVPIFEIECSPFMDLRTTMVMRDVKNMWHGWKTQNTLRRLDTPVRGILLGQMSERVCWKFSFCPSFIFSTNCAHHAVFEYWLLDRPFGE